MRNVSRAEADGVYYKVSPHKESKKLIIVFSTVDVKPGYFTFFKTMESIPENKLYLTDPDSEWFQSGVPGLGNSASEVVDQIRKVQDELGAEEIITVGSSMGASGALLYGALLGCRVLCFGARGEMGLTGSQSHTLMKQGYQFEYPDLRTLVESSDCKVVMYQGEAEKNDLITALQFKDFSNVQTITVKGVAHATPIFLNQTVGIKKVIHDFIDNKVYCGFKEQGDACDYARESEMLLESLELIAKKEWSQADSTLTSLLQSYADFDTAHHKLGIVKYHLKDFDKALHHQKEAVRISPHFANANHQLGICLRRKGSFEESYQSHMKALEYDKKLPAAYHHAGLSLEKMKRFIEAEDMFRIAAEKDTRNKKYKVKFADILRDNAIRKMKESEQILKALIS